MRRAVVIKGDGVGPELVEAAMIVMRAIRADEKIEFDIREGGSEWWMKHGGDSYLPPETWEAIKRADVVYKAPMTTIFGPGTPRSAVIAIRQTFDLYANLRPVRTIGGIEGPLGYVDMLFVRENTEGLYCGIEFQVDPDTAIALRKITRKSSERIIRFAFKEAKARGWKTVVVVHKSNVLKLTDGLFLECARKVAEEFPDIELQDYVVDNFAQQLVKNPQRFNYNVIVGPNLYMDVLTDEAGALIGSIGMLYSANIGDNFAMFEPAHGSAPKYKGQYKVNPTAMILSGAWMLDYLGFKELGKAVFEATEEVISERKVVTYDLGGSASTLEMAKAIADKAKAKLGL